MKRFLKVLFVFSLAAGLAAGCAKEYDDTELKGKVETLSKEVNTLKANQQAMQAVIDVWKKGGYIANIDNDVPGQHTITFYGTEGKTVIIYDGVDGEDGEDGEDGVGGDSFFKSVVTTEDGVTFTLQDDTSFTIPFAKAFKLVIENQSAEIEAGTPVEFPYQVQNANSTTTVEVFAGNNYEAVVNEADKKIVVTPPTPAVNGSVLVWAQNEEGLMSMRKLNFTVKADVKIDAEVVEDLKAIPADAGDVEVPIVSNIPVEVVEPEVDWVTAKVTKANYKLVLTLTENTTGEPRETTIKIVRADNQAQVQEIKIVQTAEKAGPTPLDSNVTWEIVSYAYDKEHQPQNATNVLNVTYNEVEYKNVDHVKLGTAKYPGKIKLTLPKGTVYVSFWAVGWKDYSAQLKVTELGQTFTIPANDGVSSTTFNVSVKDEDKFSITLPQALPDDTVVNVETVLDGTAPAGLRAVLFGIVASETAPEPPTPKMTVADIKALCTGKTKVPFKGEFEGMYVNYIVGTDHVYLEDASGAIRFYDEKTKLKVGDKISGLVSGTCLLDSQSRPQISTIDWWTEPGGKKESDMQAEMPKPMTGTLAEFAAMDIKDIMFRRVTLEGVELQAAVSAKGNQVNVSDGTGTYPVYVNCNPGQTIAKGSKVSFTGSFDVNGTTAVIKLHAVADVTKIEAPE